MKRPVLSRKLRGVSRTTSLLRPFPPRKTAESLVGLADGTPTGLRGFVSLVGAGPGDPKLITLRAKEALEASDVVVYDHLVHPAILKFASNAEHIYVGKKGGDSASTPQKSIESLLGRLARQRKRIVRLKGGDPFVFGRGGEEALWLKRNRIPFEIIPGITAGIAAPAYAGIPVTHRGLASDVTLITAHEDPFKGRSDVNWKALAQLKGTLVLYMGVKTLPKVVALLIRHGKKPRTPVAVIRWGTTAEQKVLTGTLKTIVRKMEEVNLTAPALVVIGAVNRLRDELKWFEEKPLFGKTVLVTRSRHQASQLGEMLEALGGRVIELPTIQISPLRDFRLLDQTIRRIDRYDWLVFTSENGAETFFDRLKQLGKDGRILNCLKIAVIGPGTKAKLESYSIVPDLIPRMFTTQGLIRALRKMGVRRKRFLLPRTDIAPEDLKRFLEESGAQVTDLAIYRTQKPEGLARKVADLIQRDPIDYMTFTSSSTARHFFEALGNGRPAVPLTLAFSPMGKGKGVERRDPKVISIGPVTSDTIRGFGVEVDRQARVPTISSLVEAVLEEAVLF